MSFPYGPPASSTASRYDTLGIVPFLYPGIIHGYTCPSSVIPPIPAVTNAAFEKRHSPKIKTRNTRTRQVTDESYPYAVSLSYLGEHFCGGVLIASDIVLTAGHCNSEYSLDGRRYEVIVGRRDLRDVSMGESIPYVLELSHPLYDHDYVDYDYGIIVLETEAKSVYSYPRINDDDGVPVGGYMPGEYDDGDTIPADDAIVLLGDALIVVGWGDTDISPNVVDASHVLMETTVYAMTNDRCMTDSGMLVNTGDTIVFEGYDGAITENMMCARAADADACQGDSGGPLVWRDGSDDVDVLVGIVSWGMGCAESAFPGGEFRMPRCLAVYVPSPTRRGRGIPFSRRSCCLCMSFSLTMFHCRYDAVYSRISAQYEWIRSTVCHNSRDPPYWYDCPTPSPVPVTPSPSRSPIPRSKLRLVVEIELDEHPTETGWLLSTLTNDGDVDGVVEEVPLYAMPIGSYVDSDAGKVLQYPVLVDAAEGWYNLTIYDAAGNGFAGTLTVNLDDGVGGSEESRSLVREPGFTEVSGNTRLL